MKALALSVLMVELCSTCPLAAATVRTASEAFVTNRIAAAVAAIPAPDFTTNNVVLTNTIAQVAPAPGDYATVSNRAINAVQTTDTDWLDVVAKTGRITTDAMGASYFFNGTADNAYNLMSEDRNHMLFFYDGRWTGFDWAGIQYRPLAYLSEVSSAATASTNYTDAAIATAATAATNYTDAAIANAADAATNYTDAAIAASPKPDWNAAPGDVAAIVNRPAVGGIDVADYRDFLAALDTLARPLGGEVVTSSRHYVQDGLVAMWDGIENTAAGTNGLAATTWTDRVGGRAFSIPSGASFTPLGLATTYANGSTIDSSATNFLFVLATNGTYTIEVAYTQTAAISHPAAGYNDYRAIFLATGRDTAKFSVGLGLRYNNQVDCVAMTISGDCSNSNAAGGHVRALYPTGGVLGAHTVSYVSASMSAASILFDGGAQSADFDIPQGDMISGNPRALYFNRNYYTGHGLDGTYHCIRIYSRALTREEVAHNREIDVMRYHGGWRPKTSGLVNDGEDGDHPFASKQEVAAAATAATNYTDAAVAAIPQGVTAPVVTNIVRDLSLGGIWDEELEVWWTPVMRNGSLTYQATTNVNLNAEN